MNETTRNLPPEENPGRDTLYQLALTAVVITVVLVWPDTIPVISVILAVLALRQD